MEVLFVDYYEIGKIKVNIKFKELVMEEINEATKAISRVDFYPIAEYEKRVPEKLLKAYKRNKPGAKTYGYWVSPDLYEADIYLPAVMNNWNDIYLFIHEIGHAVNKHGFTFDIDIQENEADIYAVKRMEQWLSKVEKEVDKDKIEHIIVCVKMRIKDRKRVKS